MFTVVGGIVSCPLGDVPQHIYLAKGVSDVEMLVLFVASGLLFEFEVDVKIAVALLEKYRSPRDHRG